MFIREVKHLTLHQVSLVEEFLAFIRMGDSQDRQGNDCPLAYKYLYAFKLFGK